jgi:hypothetical protein
MAAMTALRVVFLLVLGIGAGCSPNEPAQYPQQARQFLWKQGVSDKVIDKLTKGVPLESSEVEQLSKHENIAVLHLLAANPGTPLGIVGRLCRHDDSEVRSGVAANPNAPTEILLNLRSAGKYTTVNTMLARNPRIPQAMLREMHQNREALLSSFAMNPNCPPDVMKKIATKGDEVDRAWLAANPNLPPDLAQQLAQDKSPMVRVWFGNNPTYGKGVK